MSQTGFTPIQLYRTATPAAVPLNTDLVAGELAINYNDGVLFYEDSGGIVQVIATKDAAAGNFVNLAYTGTLTGGTGVLNIGSGQLYKSSGGIIGIGTETPTALGGNIQTVQLTGTDGGGIKLTQGATLNGTFYSSVNELLIGADAAGGIMRFLVAGVDAARITNNRDFLVGRTVTGISSAGAGFIKNAGGAYLEVVQNSNGLACAYLNQGFGSGTQTACDIRYSGTQVGTINVTSTTTSYNTTSDYRLKEVVGAITNAGERIDALKPLVYVWKINGKTTRGFLAHEFQAVYPDSVSGEKDAVDENGDEKLQTMQASSSEVIADLVAEIQSLRLRVAALGG